MGNVGYRFLISFFTLALWLLVFVNFVGWSGAYINVTSAGSVDWNNTYFGFESFQNMIKDMSGGNHFFSVKTFPQHLNEFLETCALGLPTILNATFKNSWDVVKLLTSLANLFLQPIMLVWRLGVLVGHVLYLVMEITKAVVYALSGYYNIEMQNPVTPPIL